MTANSGPSVASRDLPRLEILSKPDCCLCEEAKALLKRIRQEIPFELIERDITSDPALLERYGQEIPVGFVGGRKAFKYRVDEERLRGLLLRTRVP